MKHRLAFGLKINNDLDILLPHAIIVEEVGGKLRYFRFNALKEHLESYKLPDNDSIHHNLIEICERLDLNRLLSRFQSRNRKSVKLQEVKEDKMKYALLRQDVSRGMTRFMNLALVQQPILLLEPTRKELLNKKRIIFGDKIFYPSVKFIRMTDGIHYSMRLKYHNAELIISDKNVTLVNDQTGHFLMGHELCRLDQLNANKLKPFLSKDALLIPHRIAESYFKKFVSDVMNKVEIETEGFNIIEFDEIRKTSLIVSKNFITGDLCVTLRFDYGLACFLLANQKRSRTFIESDKLDGLKVSRVQRSSKEQDYVAILNDLGLELDKSNYLFLAHDEALASYDLIHWIIDHRQLLEEAGVYIEPIEIDGKRISIDKIESNISVDVNNDWFDVNGQITVGKFKLSFEDLRQHLIDNNPMYELPDGSYFIIPEVWMVRYGPLFKFGENANDSLQIKLSNYTLLEQAELINDHKELTVADEMDMNYVPSPNLKATLRPYQVDGVKWMIRHLTNGLGACLADDMGLGKTVQTLALLNYSYDEYEHPDDTVAVASGQLDLFSSITSNSSTTWRTLIIVPASLVFNWQNEISKFSPHFTVDAHVGSHRSSDVDQLTKFKIILTTYQTALRDIDLLKTQEWTYIILDESQMIKNRESKVFKAVNELSAENKLTLTGTPIENSLADLWSQMQFINPEMLGEFSFFKHYFIQPIEKDKDESKIQELRSMIDPFILRRRKEEVAKDLPDLIRSVEFVPMSTSQAEVFERKKSDVRNHLMGLDEDGQGFKLHILNAILKLRQIANHPILTDDQYPGTSGKFEYIIQKLELLLKSDVKILIFSSFTSHLKLYANYFDENDLAYLMLTGQTSQKNRKKTVDRFQTSADYKLFLISIKAGGTGLNLTAADYVFILDPWWNPFVEEQAIARAHRIGRKKTVHVYRFISKNSIEEKIHQLQTKKLLVAAELIESEDMIDYSKEQLIELLS